MNPPAQQCCCDLKAVMVTGAPQADDLRRRHELPSFQLRAIAQIEVLGQRVGFQPPASSTPAGAGGRPCRWFRNHPAEDREDCRHECPSIPIAGPG
jgi:hypothetical protein